MRIHRNHFFGLAAVLVGSLALASGCVVEDSDGSIADHPEAGSSSTETGGSGGSSDDGVGGTSDSGGEGGAAPTAGAAGTPQAAGGESGATPAAGGAETAGGAAGAAPAAGGGGGEAPTAGAAGSTQAAGAGGDGGAAGSTQAAGAGGDGGDGGAAPCFGDNANGGFDCNDLPGQDVLCPEEGGAGAGGAGGAAGGLMLYGIDLCISLATDGRPGIAEAFYNCVNEISPAECSTAYDDAVVACQDQVTSSACESSEATAACGRINCAGCNEILVIWSDSVISDIESCYMDLRTANPTGDCLDQLKDAEAGIGCD